MADIFGYDTPDDILNLSKAVDLIAPSDADRLLNYGHQRLDDHGGPNRYRAQGVRRDGGAVWLEVMADAVDWDGNDGILATIIDITAEVHAEAGRGHLADALNHFPEPVVLFDNEDRLIFRNDAYLRDLQLVSDYDPMGQTFEAVMRRRADDGYFPEAKGRTEEWLRERLAQHREKSGPVRVRRMREREIWLDLYDVATPNGGSLMLFVDVTELQQQEDQLRQAQKMETIGQLTGGIAHDFNNILAIIKGNLDLMEAQVEDDSPLIEILSPALRATDRGAELTHRLLAFARQQPLNISPVYVPDLLHSMDGMLRSSLGETIDVQFDCQEDLWPCKIDTAQLEQAILNLALNARDAMTGGGQLTISACNEQVNKGRADPEGDLVPGAYVLLTVTDTGAGMTPTISERVFDPFFTTKEVGQGTGLGLSMVFGLVKQSGGHISVESEPGAGATFRIYLPRAAEHDGQREKIDGPVAAKANPGETVLVVEDDDDLRSMAVQLLTNLGYRVIDAGNGAAAQIEWASDQRIDVLLANVVLPGGATGPDIALAARAARPELKVLFMSGYTDDALERHDWPDDEIDIMKKPFRLNELAQRLRETLDS
ncbi:MAG: ATP-binding protein [Alphaproteobacteria bacterium]